MEQFSFEQIKSAIARPAHKPIGGKLKVSAAPEPFVAPMFDRVDGQTGNLQKSY